MSTWASQKPSIQVKKKMLKNTEGASKNGQSIETSNIGLKTEKNHNTICVGHHHVPTNTNNTNKT
jgi:hypothetical protein